MSSFERIPYRDGSLSLNGLIARPEGAPRAAVAVFPTIANVTPAVEAKARDLAEHGYLAMICDFYGAQPLGIEQAFEWANDLRGHASRYRARLRAGIDALRDEAGGKPMLAIGFCMGGQAALEMARDGMDLRAVASFHGLLETTAPAEPNAMKARILVCHGDADPLVPRGHVLAFWEEMDRAGANWHFHSYSGVKHGFTNPNPPRDNTAVDYDESADRQSWAAMYSLFDEELARRY